MEEKLNEHLKFALKSIKIHHFVFKTAPEMMLIQNHNKNFENLNQMPNISYITRFSAQKLNDIYQCAIALRTYLFRSENDFPKSENETEIKNWIFFSKIYAISTFSVKNDIPNNDKEIDLFLKETVIGITFPTIRANLVMFFANSGWSELNIPLINPAKVFSTPKPFPINDHTQKQG